MAWCKRQCLTILQGFSTRKAAAAAAATSTLTRSWKKQTKKISIFSDFIRRNASTIAPFKGEEKKQKEIVEEVSFKSMSLYLCFEEWYTTNNVHVIQSIRLNHLLTPSVHGGDDLNKLQKIAYRCGPRTIVPNFMSTSVVGSKVMFVRGYVPTDTTSHIVQYSLSKEVCLFETDPSIDPNPSLQPSQAFKITRPEYVLREVDNKLYRFQFNGRCDVCESFEVFEPLQDEWLPLDVPPLKCPHGFNHAIAGTKILVWGRDQTGVYMFDVTNPKKGWKELDPCLGSYIPSINAYDQLFVKLKSGHGHDEGFLMFSINLEEPDKVLVSHMSHACDSLKLMEPLQLQLPKVRPPKSNCPDRWKFFYLGGQKVGIVFSCDHREYNYEIDDYFIPHHDDDNDEDDDDEDDDKDDDHNNDDNGGCYGLDVNDKARVLVIIFEYEIAEESMDIKYKLLSSRSLEYSTKNHGEYQTYCSFLIGAYVL
ncbi:hypothetical protein ACLB2K_061616 [Fragaria x ananassa]